jgi:sirohydrochlorin ferrochelatase
LPTPSRTAWRRGLGRVIVFPYFLAPGRHWHEDIPRLAAEAAASHPGIEHLVTPPIGQHPLILAIIDERISQATGRQHPDV